jgi:biofilm PGA synthesis N-glycosyltransferase PgaC
MTTITVLVPAHNEEEQIAQTIESLLAQTRTPDQIVVVSDHSADRTVEIASRYPITVVETVNNKHRKSGALLQAWRAYGQDSDYIFTMDADTVLAPDFFELAVNLMDENDDLGGACACPMLKDTPENLTRWQDILWRMGKLDFGGYMRILCRWKFSPEVLFGYGTIFRNSALKQIASESPDNAPWDVNSIVEDYKASIDLRRLGWRLSIIPGAFAYTDVPTSLKELWIQRMRWAGGTWQELVRAGWHPYTKKVWITAVACVGSAVLRLMAILAWVLVLAFQMEIALSPIWLIPVVVGIVDRIDMTRYTKGADWKDVVLVSSLVPLEAMAVLREAWTIWSAWVVARRKNLAW